VRLDALAKPRCGASFLDFARFFAKNRVPLFRSAF
jgi:hypothetical protein